MCGRELHLRFIYVRDESFCSGIHAKEFFWVLDEHSVKLETESALPGGSNGYFQIESESVVSRE